MIAGISACSNSDRNLLLVADSDSDSGLAAVYVNGTDTIKGFVPNATIFNYTITGDLAGCTVATLNSDATLTSFSVNNSGTTYRGGIVVNCLNLGASTYTGTVSMTTTSGGYNYSGSLPVTITV
ncbi:hypothetical protein [Francisella hispaniensis]|uniref:Uncharacterized protein n=1 Tax=Francisella hispaniensis TaxID=622488 RepID=F4BG54_9GAMM|nr:hypothetical protein [Francisella hispaniensis]AEE26448.1 hypothetical protein FN3523_1145 [Francisella hispaniensis]